MNLQERLHGYGKQVLIHLWGPAGSVLFHVALVVILINFAVSGPAEKVNKVEMTIIEPNATKLDEKVEEVIKKLDEQPKDVDNNEPPSDAISFANQDNEQVGGTGNLEEGTSIGSGDASLPTGFEISSTVKGNLVMKGLYANRTAGGRKGALGRYGGTGAGETSVNKALRWLKEHQETNGCWEGSSPEAMTGLALLTFLAHGETPSSKEYGPTVERALKYLMEKQQPNGAFGVGNGNHHPYIHGICTYAVCEGYALTKIMMLKDSMDRAVGYMIAGQQPTGGFNYGYSKGDRFDLSVSGWQCQALKAAKMAGCSNEQLEDAIKLAIDFLKKEAYDPTRGGFVYAGKPGIQSSGGSKMSMTGAGVLCLQLLGQPSCAEVRSGLEFLKDTTCSWEAKDGGKNEIYGWYYVTQAKFQKGGPEWDAWNKQFSREVTLNQKPDGHWENGDWEEQSGKKFVYSTTLCALMLQVYYRYLPSYHKVEDSAPDETVAKPDEGAVKVM